MTVAAAQASAFYEQVARDGMVFTFLADGSFLVFPIHGNEVVPFWSSHSRITAVQEAHATYREFEVSEIPLSEFLDSTLPQLREERISVGVNWSGSRLTGYDIAPDEMQRSISYWLQKGRGEG